MTRFAQLFPNARTLSALLLTAFLALAGCDSTGTEPENQPGSPPPLPAATSMDVDFGLFQSGGGAEAMAAAYSDLVALGDAASGTQINFATASLSVLVAQLVTVVHLAVPTVLFAAAANNTPSFEEDGLWHWRYSASQGGQLFTAHLSGVVVGSSVEWQMRITAPQATPALDDFLWYGGTGQVDGTSGTWRFYDPSNPAGSSEVVRVDWSHESSDVHGVTITVVSGDDAGDILTADHNGSTRLVTFTDASDGDEVEIFWDVATGEGYIMAPNFNGGLRACWDAGQNDIPCA